MVRQVDGEAAIVFSVKFKKSVMPPNDMQNSIALKSLLRQVFHSGRVQLSI